MNKLWLALLICVAVIGSAIGQNIEKYYVSKTEDAGTLYHTLPCTLFEAARVGELTFDITYQSNGSAIATINFTCDMDGTFTADSVCFSSGSTQMKGVVKKIYISPRKKKWEHRYSLIVDAKALFAFFNVSATPQVELYVQGAPCVYKAKTAAWKSTAPVMSKIFEMISINEAH